MSNDALVSLEGLNSLARVGLDLVISSNASLTSLGLGNLSIVGNNLLIGRNPVLDVGLAETLAERLRAAGFYGRVRIS